MSSTTSNIATPAAPGLACLASSTHRSQPEDSQDAAACARLPTTGYPALIVADGLGSFAYAGEAAQFAVRTAQALLEGRSVAPLRTLPELFSQVQERLARYAKSQMARSTESASLDPTRAWGTTLLVAVETKETLLVAYVGNGGLFHIRGNFAAAGAGLRRPWNYTNLLNPHSVYEEGREALTHYLAASATPEQIEPTVLQIRKDPYHGDLLLLCTDGVFSQDQVRYGNPGDGSLWGEVDRPLLAVHQTLCDRFQLTEQVTAERLQQALAATLTALRERQELDDDATLGLLVTAPALTLQQ